MYKTRILIIFILLLCFSLEGVVLSSPREKTQEVIEYSRAYRIDTKLPVDKEELRQKRVLEQVFDCLPKYDSYNSMDSAVNSFFSDALSLKGNSYMIIDASQTDIGGKSHDIVYFVKDADGNLSYIIKAFRNPRDLSSKFLPEISALDFIGKLSLPGVIAIQPIAFAIYAKHGSEWGLLLETAASGHRIDDFVYKLGDLAPNSEERESFLQNCLRAFQRTAESLAELHAKKSSKVNILPQIDLKEYDQKVSNILANPFIIQELEKHFSMEQLLSYIHHIKTEALKTPVFYSYWHGDAHLGNMIYDEATDIFYLIDVAKLHYSISNTEEPLLDGMIDLIRVEENLQRRAIGLLSGDEVKTLMTSFYETYERASGQKIAKPLLLFHRTAKKLSRLNSYSNYMNEADPVKSATDQAVFESALDYFRKQLNKIEGQNSGF